ncbi:Uncharacterised protein [Serratia marcescens]|uniref:hypothetical protein n=1 Tax=Serratia marcescens TaxID=615 RepID=UPI0007454F7C|nr:hypothetical protein [Serratia marcescens]CUZ82877.1 Uncharacterised protein [Serratia marcescens]CVA51088.1 Uncharacterised protein [Serratia marcescens]CVA77448.1 Uncharacterised protein [Serratia marcescens]CVH12907.1 Uncharacterised protein [Serratia marcescens]
MSNEPKFPELPVELQVALVTAATAMATTKISALGSKYNQNFNFFDREYKLICDSLYKENRGRNY